MTAETRAKAEAMTDFQAREATLRAAQMREVIQARDAAAAGGGHSMISSALASSAPEIVTCSAFAGFRFITSSNL
jgi:hypothetical protein